MGERLLDATASAARALVDGDARTTQHSLRLERQRRVRALLCERAMLNAMNVPLAATSMRALADAASARGDFGGASSHASSALRGVVAQHVRELTDTAATLVADLRIAALPSTSTTSIASSTTTTTTTTTSSGWRRRLTIAMAALRLVGRRGWLIAQTLCRVGKFVFFRNNFF